MRRSVQYISVRRGATAALFAVGRYSSDLRRAALKFETDILSALPEHRPSDFRQEFSAVDDGEKMVAGKLSDFAGEAGAAVREENLALTEPTGMEEDISGSRMAGCIFVRDAEVQVAERDPGSFAAPPCLQELALKGKQLAKSSARNRRELIFKQPGEMQPSDPNAYQRHKSLPTILKIAKLTRDYTQSDK